MDELETTLNTLRLIIFICVLVGLLIQWSIFLEPNCTKKCVHHHERETPPPLPPRYPPDDDFRFTKL